MSCGGTESVEVDVSETVVVGGLLEGVLLLEVLLLLLLLLLGLLEVCLLIEVSEGVGIGVGGLWIVEVA